MEPPKSYFLPPVSQRFELVSKKEELVPCYDIPQAKDSPQNVDSE